MRFLIKEDCIFLLKKPAYFECSALKEVICENCNFYKSSEAYNRDGTKRKEETEDDKRGSYKGA